MKNDLPTESEIITLHKKYAPSEELYTAVYTHCLAVWQVAKQIIDSQELNSTVNSLKPPVSFMTLVRIASYNQPTQ